ncbi:type II toxin-antitoxin system Phd/YefM family antitoxin [Levilactobacillus yonginensis]|uniref:type II toxin-antitoxin system Phd/YefM family antitoxin n=1 Tax=Levilactobacillus yonginensis TaxID=1054041 RepID=UPI00345C96E2
MNATTFARFRKEMKRFVDQVTDDYEAIIITRKNKRNAVLISVEEYNNLLESRYVLNKPENLAWLQESLIQVNAGKVATHTLLTEQEVAEQDE